jgi:hypothetical protein
MVSLYNDLEKGCSKIKYNFIKKKPKSSLDQNMGQ